MSPFSCLGGEVVRRLIPALVIVPVAMCASCTRARDEAGGQVVSPRTARSPSTPAAQASQASGSAAQSAREPAGLVKRSELVLRRSATAVVVPSYPPQSLKNGSAGVAVASVLVGADGIVRSVDVVQAPDSDIGQAVRSAVVQWRFRPVSIMGSNVLRPVASTLTFYFQIHDGRGRVLSPDEIAPASSGRDEAHR